ncbi:MAG: ATP-binding protein [Fusobacteriaceae bacterium]|jgi:predicted AAA+ superfamily ATPase|nr:ATP-binding protein [Fusobacteriaceae bacterium]
MYIKRHIEEAVRKRGREKGAVVLTGPRQVGKTTLMENLVPDLPKITFDYLDIRRSAQNEPGAFLELNPPPVFMDEVQYVPELFPYIKIYLDKNKQKGAFFLTGSQSFELMKNVTESLAGRAGILELTGLSLREMRNETWSTPFLPTADYLSERKKSKIDLPLKSTWEIIHRGSLPELFQNPEIDWQNYYSDYIKTYIERDVRKLTQVVDEMQFLQFMGVCAAMTGQLLNLSSLARDVGISEPTAKRWLSILKTNGIVYLLRPYFNNAILKAVKTPKLYFMDTGLAAYLTRWLTPETLFSGAMKGSFFESFVVAEILKSYHNAGKEADLYFLRDGNRQEIDLIIFQDNTLFPMEIKATVNPSAGDIRHFQMLSAIPGIKIGAGGIICPASELLPLQGEHKVIPLWAV